LIWFALSVEWYDLGGALYFAGSKYAGNKFHTTIDNTMLLNISMSKPPTRA